MNHILLRTVILVIIPLLSGIVVADTLSVGFSFTAKPPRAAVIYAADGTYKPIQSAVVDQNDKKFNKSIYVVSPTSELHFKNSDTIDHNIFSRGGEAAQGFDIGLLSPSGEKIVAVNWKPAAFERMGCKIHPKMKAYIASVPNDAYLSIPFKEEGVKDNYSLDIDGSTTKFGLIIPGYDPIQVELGVGSSTEVQLQKRGKVKGTAFLKRS